MNDTLGAVMTQLQEPAPPTTLKATVMARIAREADREQPDAAAQAVRLRRRRESPAWLWTLAGLVVVLGVTAYGWFEAGALPDVTSPRTAGGLSLIPTEGPLALIVGLGLLVYMAGLIAPLRSGERR